MNRSQRLAAEQKQRMFGFLDVVKGILRGLPAEEICIKAQAAAKECSGSTGAAIYICPDNAPPVLIAARSVVDDAEESAPEPTAAEQKRMEAEKRILDEKNANEPEMIQLVPPLLEGMWPAVMRLAQAAVVANGTIEEDVDINDNGLPEALRVESKPKMSRCIVTPLAVRPDLAGGGSGGAEGGRIESGDALSGGANGRALGVLAVWGGRHVYTPADEQVLGCLAVLTAHLLVSDDQSRQADELIAKQRESLRTLEEQQTNLVRYASQLGTLDPKALHEVAHRLATPLGCAACVLWLVHTEPGQTVQTMTAFLPADYRLPVRAELDTDDDVSGGGGGGGGSAAVRVTVQSVSGGRLVTVPMEGGGLIGQVVTTARPLRVADAHIHHAYAPDIDEAACVLEEGHTAICIAPVVDYAGRVLGVLQACAKQDPQITAERTDMLLWERDVLATAKFSSLDQAFLTILADRMALQLQVNTLKGLSTSEVVDQQGVTAELRAQVERHQVELLAKKREVHATHHGSGRKPGLVRLPAVDAPPRGRADSDADVPRARRSAMSQPELRGRPRLDGLGGRRPIASPFDEQRPASRDRQQQPPAASVMSASGSSDSLLTMRPNLATPDSIWEDLCRTLREL